MRCEENVDKKTKIKIQKWWRVESQRTASANTLIMNVKIPNGLCIVYCIAVVVIYSTSLFFSSSFGISSSRYAIKVTTLLFFYWIGYNSVSGASKMELNKYALRLVLILKLKGIFKRQKIRHMQIENSVHMGFWRIALWAYALMKSALNTWRMSTSGNFANYFAWISIKLLVHQNRIQLHSLLWYIFILE